MHLDQEQRRTLSTNWSAFLKARKLTPSRVRRNYGMSYGTAKNLTDPAKYSAMTVPLIRRVTQLTNKSLKDLTTTRIEWPDNGARGNGQHAPQTKKAKRPASHAKQRGRQRPKAGARPARRVVVPEPRLVLLQLGEGTEISVPEGVKITVTGPRSLRIEG
jgi:hypothetical protein